MTKSVRLAYAQRERIPIIRRIRYTKRFIDSVCVELAPVVRVSNVRSAVVKSRSVQLTWDRVSCWQRLGVQPRYDIVAFESPASQSPPAVNTSTRTPPPYWLYALRPYTLYAVRVRYANEHGAAPYSKDVMITTQPDGRLYAYQSLN